MSGPLPIQGITSNVLAAFQVSSTPGTTAGPQPTKPSPFGTDKVDIKCFPNPIELDPPVPPDPPDPPGSPAPPHGG